MSFMLLLDVEISVAGGCGAGSRLNLSMSFMLLLDVEISVVGAVEQEAA